MIVDLGKLSLSDFTAKGDVLVDFWASWCQPCKQISRELDRLSAMIPNLQIVKVNVDERPDLVQQYEIKSVPLVVHFKKGAAPQSTNGVWYAEELVTRFGLHP